MSLLVAAMAGEEELIGLRLARGCRCFAAFAGGELVAYGWLSSGAEWIGELRLEVTPETGEWYVWNCLTLPAHRRRGMFRAVLVQISSALREEGIARLWITTGGGPAEKALPDAGFRPVLRLGESPLGLARLRVVTAGAIAGCEPDLVSASRRVLGGRGRRLPPSSLGRRPAQRRH